jgi:hypothetical protein
MRAILALTLIVLGTNGAIQEKHLAAGSAVTARTAELIRALDDASESAAPRGNRLDIVAPPAQQSSPRGAELRIADATPETDELPAAAELLSSVPDGLIVGPDGLAIRPSDIPDAADKADDPSGGGAQTSRQVPLDELCNTLFNSAENNDLPVPFFANLIWQESRLHDDTVSRAGALGIAQFMPKVAAETGLDDPFDPLQALPASARLLRTLREHFGNLGFVAAAYNAGAHRVSEWLQHHRALPRETRDYVVKVTGRSAEQWRTATVQDDALTFVRHLPCRGLPAFADLEQAQQQQAQAEQAAQGVQAKAAPVPAKAAPAAAKVEKVSEPEIDHRRGHPRSDIHVAGREPHEERRRIAHAEHPAHERYHSAHREKGRSKTA